MDEDDNGKLRIERGKALLLEISMFKQHYLQMSQIQQIWLHFHPLEVVGRGSETQLQVGENLNKLTQPWR